MTQHTVPVGVPEMALARYLARAYPMLPAGIARRALSQRDVRREGLRLGAGDTVRGGDVLTVYIDARYLSGPVDVIYVDDGLLAINKPAGLPVDVDADGVGADTLIARAATLAASEQVGLLFGGADALIARGTAQFAGGAGCLTIPRLCHRLDAWTSGVTLIALNQAAYDAVTAAFARHAVEKRYICVVVGAPPKENATLYAYLVKDAQRAQVHVVNRPMPGALAIETRYHLLERRGAVSKLEVFPVTGRTHQIRAHLASVGLPILGDDRYGDRAANRREGMAHQMLHCRALRLPQDGIPEAYRGMEFVAEAPF